MPRKARTRKQVARDEYGLVPWEREFADLYRGANDEKDRGCAWRCYKVVKPHVTQKTAEVEGSKLLKKPKIAGYLATKAKEIEIRADITQERVLRELSCIAFSDLRKLFRPDGSLKSIHELDSETAAAIAHVEVAQGNLVSTAKIRIYDKLGALDKLGRHFKIFTDKVEHDACGTLADLLNEINGKSLGPPGQR